MKIGYKIIHETNFVEEDTILEVINWESENVIQFYSWTEPGETDWIEETIGIWKIKKLK